MKSFLLMVLGAALLLSIGPPKVDAAQARKTVHCEVVKVYDGDYVGCATATGVRPYRFIAIDAPEIRYAQPYALEARDELRRLILGKDVKLELIGRETRWGRRLVRVWLDGSDVGLELVSRGAVWFFPQYARGLPAADRQVYQVAHDLAQSERRGLWKGESPIKPSQWRKGKRASPLEIANAKASG